MKQPQITSVLVLTTLVSLCACQSNSIGTDRKPNLIKVFPSDFMFGVSTAAYQVEGAWNVSGKSESIWDVFTHTPGRILDNSTGDDACKSYEYYKRDIQMLKYLGVDFYRISISWTRILPKGFPVEINKAGLDYYNNIINELIKNNIDPIVTIYHWDIPQSLQDLGGWANPLVVQWMEDYARVLFDSFGDRVKFWITINEPEQIVLGYGTKTFAPGINAHGVGDYLAARHIVLAHARVWHLYDKEYRQKQKGMIGITLSTDFRQGITNSSEDAQAAQDAMEFEVGIYAHPIFSSFGGFPPRVLQLVAEKSKQQGYPRSRLIDFTDEEREYCKGTSDFFGMNHYSTKYVSRRGYKPGKNIPSKKDDLGVVESFLNYPRTASNHIALIPHGVRGILNWVKNSYNDPLILITENGVANKGTKYDLDKIDYFKKYLSNIWDAMYEDGVMVMGYTAWSLMDNFEWSEGYIPKFGIFKVHFKDERRTREARLSALWYKDLIATNTLKPDYLPTYKKIEF